MSGVIGKIIICGILGHIVASVIRHVKLMNNEQEENWTNSVHNHDNEHAVTWAISMHIVWG